MNKYYCPDCEQPLARDSNQCPRCGKLFQHEGTYTDPSPANKEDILTGGGFCVNCEATRRLTEQMACEKCGSTVIWKPNAVKEFVRLGLKQLIFEDPNQMKLKL